MKRVITAVMVAGVVFAAAGASFAGENKQTTRKAPVKMTAAQMDQVVAGRRAGYDEHVNYQTGKTNQVGDNTYDNNQRGSNGNGSKIYDYNSN